MKDLNLSQLGKKIGDVFKRFHMTIFIVVIAVGLIAAVLMLNSTINRSTDSSSLNDGSEATGFDQATMDKVQKLQEINQSKSSTKLPGGRINPFVE
ncbi:MAG: hypothetical protein L0H36_01485 [bacterium]|nr:hypothetical protein [bacterium]MDN5835289.1 hypothetical protein [bacterium]